MLGHEMTRLQQTLEWARFDLDMDVVQLAQQHLQQLESQIIALPEALQASAWQQLDSVLPMEWPLWVEMSRQALDSEQSAVLH